MSEFTPGPWAFHGPRTNIHVCQADDPNMRICFMTSDGPTVANARLIAAAPDLLALAKAQHGAIDWLMARLITCDPSFRPTKSPIWPAVEGAYALIQKVEGVANV